MGQIFADMSPALWRIGLTGGIGSGKSTVAHMLANLGATVIDADAISRQTTAPGGLAINAIADEFGVGMVSAEGRLNRQAMRQLIFTNAAARTRLEAIVHPLVHAEMQRQETAAVAAWKLQNEHPLHPQQQPQRNTPSNQLKKSGCIVFDIPLLVESGNWRTRLDRVLVIDCSVKVQIARVIARDGSSATAVEKAIAAQASRPARLSVADSCIQNGFETCLESLHLQVCKLAQTFGL